MKISSRLMMALLVSGVTLIVCVVGLHLSPIFGNWSNDILVNTVGGVGRSADPGVVLLLIDEDSIAYGEKLKLGRWPWPRSIYSEILDFINKTHPPKAIFFDILFSESSQETNQDAVFSEAVARSGNVVHNMLFAHNTERTNTIPLPSDVASHFSIVVSNEHAAGFTWNQANQYTIPVRELRALDEATPIALGLAMADFSPDPDGVYRRGRMLFRYGSGADTRYYPSLSLKAIMTLAGISAVTLDGNTIHVGKYSIPVDDNGRTLVNYLPESLPAWSMSALMESAWHLEQGEPEKMKISPDAFSNKIVIIGVSAVGGQDLKNTPIAPALPGPAIHANLISDILQQNHITVEPRWISWLLVLLVTALSIGVMFSKYSSGRRILVQAGTLLLYLLLALLAFRFGNYSSPLLVIVLSGLGASALGWGYASITEGAERRKYSKILGNMVDPGIVREALNDLDALKRGGEKQITAFFSDVASFSTISEKLASTDLAALLNEYLSEMTLILKRHGGTLDKYIGDAVVGIFGAPVAIPETELAAVRASVEMRTRLDEMRRDWVTRNAWCPEAQAMHFRIGLNSGLAKVGFMGTDTLASYTMMGDTVNLAARLEAAGKDYGVEILVSESIQEKAGTEFEMRKLDLVRVKGKHQPVTLYEVIGKKGEVQPAILEARDFYEQAFTGYLERDFAGALQRLELAGKALGGRDASIELLASRCILFKENPPSADWDGVFTRTHK